MRCSVYLDLIAQEALQHLQFVSPAGFNLSAFLRFSLVREAKKAGWSEVEASRRVDRKLRRRRRIVTGAGS